MRLTVELIFLGVQQLPRPGVVALKAPLRTHSTDVVAVVTGVTSGLGAANLDELAAARAEVFGLDLRRAGEDEPARPGPPSCPPRRASDGRRRHWHGGAPVANRRELRRRRSRRPGRQPHALPRHCFVLLTAAGQHRRDCHGDAVAPQAMSSLDPTVDGGRGLIVNTTWMESSMVGSGKLRTPSPKELSSP